MRLSRRVLLVNDMNMQTTTIGVFHNVEDAEHAIIQLKDHGIDERAISYVYTDDKEAEPSDSVASHTVQGATTGIATGAVVGAIAGLVVANGVIPGLGTLFVAGPLATALGLTGVAATTASGAITGAAAGGLVGVLVGLGVDASNASRYEARIKDGDLLVAVNSSDTSVREVFRENHADEIGIYEQSGQLSS